METEVDKRTAGIRREFEQKITEEFNASKKLQLEAQQFEEEVEFKLQSLRSEMQTMEDKFKTKCAEVVALKAQNVDLETAARRVQEEIKLQFAEQLSDIRNQHTAELLEAQQKLLQLKEQQSIQDRENQLWREKIRKDTELQLRNAFEE